MNTGVTNVGQDFDKYRLTTGIIGKSDFTEQLSTNIRTCWDIRPNLWIGEMSLKLAIYGYVAMLTLSICNNLIIINLNLFEFRTELRYCSQV